MAKKKKKKKSKINKKFLRNICIGIISMIIVAFIINIAPGYKRDKYTNITNLVISDTNVTEELKHIIYINENDTVYMSKEDTEKLIDKTIYFDENAKTIITTSENCTASMKVGEKSLRTNGANIQTLDTIIYLDNIMYIPISELEEVYNMKIEYKKDSNIVVIDYLNKGIITAELSEDVKMKYRPRGLSKNVTKLEKSDRVYAFYTTSKGWRLIRTEDGIIGYVKANTLTNEYIVRQDMEARKETQKIKMKIQNGSVQQIENEPILIKDLFTISNEGIVAKESIPEGQSEISTTVWANLSKTTNINLSDYNKRTEFIDKIVSIAYDYKIKGININFEGNEEGLERFIIELTPRLREMGITTNLIVNKNIDGNRYTGTVDYLITNE